jgi:hypothetical protein
VILNFLLLKCNFDFEHFLLDFRKEVICNMIKSNVAPLKKMEYQLVSSDEIALEKLHYFLAIK